jgi:proline iminopeptidase
MLATVNGSEIYYEVIGSGRPLMLMHGGLGLDHTYFRPWLDPLADDLQLIFFDFSGHGRSPRPQGFDGVTHATWADEADGLRAHLGFERIVLFGHSYGGFLAMEYALRHPERLDGLILSCTGPALDNAGEAIANAKARGTDEQVETLLSGLSNPLPSDQAFYRFWKTILPLYFKRYDPELGARVLSEHATYSVAGFNHAFGQCIPSYNVENRLSEIATPTLILSGRDDYILGPTQGDRILAQLPNATHHIFEESGHFPFVEETDKYLATIRTWTTSLP